MVQCNNCKWIGEEFELTKVKAFLDDDPWGMGVSYYYEWLCPECKDDDIEDGIICENCGKFIVCDLMYFDSFLSGGECDCDQNPE